VDATLRRSMRQAVLLGGPVLVVLLAADSAQDLLRGGLLARASAVIDVGVMVAAMVGVLVVRSWAWPEPVALALLLLVFTSSTVQRGLVTDHPSLSLAYAVTLVVASGLFLPWRPTWHLAWLAMAVVVTALAALAGVFGSEEETVSVVVAIVIAALASGVGQPLAHVRLRHGLEQQFELRLMGRYAQRQESRVAQLNLDLMRTARLDAVTGLGNRRALDDALGALAGHRLAAVLLDLDHFKAYNDRFGHLAGDAALARVGELMRETVRADDLVFRYGGEEFLVLIPGADEAGASRLAERIRHAVRDDRRTGLEGLTISAGVAVADRFSASDPVPLLRRADSALYRAKRDGRDRVVIDAPTSRAASAPMAG
jgi:diguanylate cyclase (GGDEF)-like protein